METTNESYIEKRQGKYGSIQLSSSHREVTEADEDIHALIARLLIEQERENMETVNATQTG